MSGTPKHEFYIWQTFRVTGYDEELGCHNCETVHLHETMNIDLMVDGGFPEGVGPYDLIGRAFRAKLHPWICLAGNIEELEI